MAAVIFIVLTVIKGLAVLLGQRVTTMSLHLHARPPFIALLW